MAPASHDVTGRRYSIHDHPGGYDAYNNETPAFEIESMTTQSQDAEKVNIFIIFVFILELLVLIFVCVLEYFLRVTDVFPVRQVDFSCTDESLSHSVEQGERSYRGFAYLANVSYEVIIPLCFCIPPVIVLISELALWAFTEDPQKTVRALCKQCKLPQVARRMIRFIGTYLFGLLMTMIFVDVAKMFVGRPRPCYLAICQPDLSLCTTAGLSNSTVCTETNSWIVRDAGLSFPSLHAAMTAFAATFLAVYIHHVIRASSVHILRPFLALGFLLLSVMCCLARYGLNYSHWTDVAVGFGLGVIFSVYVTVFALNRFQEHQGTTELYSRIRDFMFEQRALELRDLYKENRLTYANYPGTGVYAGGLILPRPHVHPTSSTPHNESTTDDEPVAAPSHHHPQPKPTPHTHHQHDHHSNPRLRHGQTHHPAQPRPHSIEPVGDRQSYHFEHHSYPRPSQESRHPQQQQQELTEGGGIKPQNTFQRDLQRTLDSYRRSSPGYGHI